MSRVTTSSSSVVMPTVHVFSATSLDGFIARPDGDIDWLLQRDAPFEYHGYSAFIAEKDVVVMDLLNNRWGLTAL